MVGMPFTFFHLIHLYSPKLFRQGIFTLVARSKRVLVSPKNDKDRGWYTRFVAAPTTGLVGEENVPFPEKHNFARKLLSVAPMDGRSWKNFSHRFGWKVKTHGFPIRGISAEVVVASRIYLERAQEIILGSSLKRKASANQDSEEEEEQDGGSLVKRPQSRRRIISDDEASQPHSVPLSEPVEATLVISDDDTPAAAHDSVDQLFARGFDNETMTVAIVAPPQAILTPSTVPPTTVQHTEVGSSSRSGAMKQVVIEVPADDQPRWYRNDEEVFPHGALMHEYQTEANNRREQYESLQIDMEALEESKCILEQQLKVLTSELAVEKATSNQAGKDKNLLDTFFSEQLSKASEEIRELKALLSEKEVYAGELVQTLTQTQEDLQESSDKVRSLESSRASLQTSYNSALAENEKLKSEIAEWEKDMRFLRIRP
ncbi:uncharacterized protein [Nicotiana sylvestris]|uniref:uncharacterized protein n=1 Tax=Nicotiana sylvestris TaxID=4096 RepID=UPI00388CA9A6